MGNVDRVMLALVVLIPILAIGAYVMNQEGFFNPASTEPAQTSPQTTPVQTTQTQPVAQSPATITLDEPDALPVTVTVAEIVPFSFTLQNTGNAGSTYQYKVYVKWQSGADTGKEDVIDVNSISLAAGVSKDIPESLKFETAPATAEVYFELEPSGQNISFELPRTQ